MSTLSANSMSVVWGSLWRIILNMLLRCRAVALSLIATCIGTCTVIKVYLERRAIRWGLPKGSQPQRQHPPKPKDDDYYRGRARRVHAVLRLLESRIFPRPKYFVTLIFPDKLPFKHLTRRTPAATQRQLRRLFKSFTDRFPDGYLLWSIEYVEERGVHAHAACTTGTGITEIKLTTWFSAHWWRVCGFEDERAVDVREYDYGDKDGRHGGYMAKFSKLNHKAALIKCFGSLRTFGVVGKKNMPLQEPIVHHLSLEELEELRAPLLEHIKQRRDKIRASSLSEKEKARKISRLKKQFDKIKSNFCQHFFDLSEDLHEIVRNKLRELCNRRARAAVATARRARKMHQNRLSTRSR